MNPSQIKQLPPGATLWDDVVTGLQLRHRGKSLTFHLYYRTRAGVQRRPKLGSFPTLSLADARSIARELLSRVATGEDPSKDWKTAKGEMTLEALYVVALAECWGKKKYKTSGYLREVEANWRNHLSPLAKEKLSALTAPVIRDWHRGYEESPYAGNRSKAVLSRLFSFAEEKGWRPPSSNPCSAVPDHAEVKRERYAKGAEIPAIGAILARESSTSPAEVAFIYLLMFTGSRPRAIERCTLEQLETLPNGVGVLTFDGKTGRETVIVPIQAMRILAALPSERETLTGVKFPRAFWERVREEAGCPDLWARDWRRTFATVGLSNGMNLDGLGALLNHKDPATTQIYAKLIHDARVEMASSIATKMEGLLKGTFRRAS